MKIILGAGRYQRQEGWFTNDVRKFDGIDHVFDLNKTWELLSDTCDALSAIHVVEHVDNLIHFMDEAWRVLAKGGTIYIETPLAGGDPDLEYADPTHVRCYRKHTFINYFTKEGIERFGYTDKPWAILHIEATDDSVLKVHLTPLK